MREAGAETDSAGPAPDAGTGPVAPEATLGTVAKEWTRIGVTGFGGPPAHIVLLRRLVVDRMRWMDAREFQDANAACGLLPGPASTQLSIFCAYRVAGPAGAVVGGLGFILPAVVLIIALSVLFLAQSPPLWVRGAGAGAGAAVAAVAVQAARGLIGPSLQQVRGNRGRTVRWSAYLAIGTASAALLGPYLVLALLACGLLELAISHRLRPSGPLGLLLPGVVSVGGIGALAWTAFKVGALSFGGGFVIIPLMQGDAVHAYHWMTNAQFLNAVALGQVTPGPVVATVAAVGYAAHGVAGGLLAALVAFAPSFSFILIGGPRFELLRNNRRARAFLDGAGPAAIGAILGAAILLAIALQQAWQFAILAAAAVALLIFKRNVVETLVTAGALGVIAALAGAPLPH
jgi:chromate transporter